VRGKCFQLLMALNEGDDETAPLQADGRELIGFSESAVRHGFVQKVYGILGAQLVSTTIIGGTTMTMFKTMKQTHPEVLFFLMFGSLAISISMMCVFMCKPDLMRQSPTNYVLLAMFTLAESVMVGAICVQYTQESVLIALGITCLVVVGLTVFACQTTYDFTGFGPYLFCGCLVLMGFGFTLSIVSMFGLTGEAFKIANICHAAMGALLFSVYIVYDTQLIIGGKHKHRFSIDDYAVAAISLYIDIVQLFLHLLRIFGKRR